MKGFQIVLAYHYFILNLLINLLENNFTFSYIKVDNMNKKQGKIQIYHLKSNLSIYPDVQMKSKTK